MFSLKYIPEENRVYSALEGEMTVSDIQNYKREFLEIHEEVEPGWTLLVDIRKMGHLSDEAYKVLNELREAGVKRGLRKAALVGNDFVNMVRSSKTLREVENAYEQQHFVSFKDAIAFLTA